MPRTGDIIGAAGTALTAAQVIQALIGQGYSLEDIQKAIGIGAPSGVPAAPDASGAVPWQPGQLPNGAGAPPPGAASPAPGVATPWQPGQLPNGAGAPAPQGAALPPVAGNGPSALPGSSASNLPQGGALPHPTGPAYPGAPLPTAPAPLPNAPSPLPGAPAPAIPGRAVGTAATAAGAAKPNIIESIVNAVRGHPYIAAGVGLTTAAAAALAYNRAGESPPAAAAAPAAPTTPALTPEQQQQAADSRRSTDDAAALQEQQAAAYQQQAAYAAAQKAKLEDEMAKSDMTDSQKEAARRQLETDLANLNNSAAASRTAATEAGANSRTAAQEAGANSRTAAQEAGATSRTQITEAGANSRTAAQEAGANTRAGYEGQVQTRGQDIQARQAQDQFVSQMMANAVAQGQLSLDKAQKQWQAYIDQAKLPSTILSNVSQAIQPFLPYLTARKDGDAAPGFEAGGPMAQLVKASGAKYNPSNYAVHPVNIDLGSIAQQYGAPAPGTTKPMPTVDQVFAGAGQQAQNADPAALRAQSASSNLPPAPTFGAAPAPAPAPSAPQGSPVDGLMPQTWTAPMTPDQEQQIRASLQ